MFWPAESGTKSVGFSQTQPGLQACHRSKRGTRGGRRVRAKAKKVIAATGNFNSITVVLTDSKKIVLDKGLIFAPPRRPNKFETHMDVHKFI